MRILTTIVISLLLFAQGAFAAPPTVTRYPVNQYFYNPSNSNTIQESYAFANVAASQTDSALVAAVTGKKIRVTSIVAVTGGTATTTVFNTKPAGAGTAISPSFQLGVNGVLALPFNPAGYFETTSGQGLSVTTGAGSTTGYLIGYITY